jgi:hypothetical protein
MASLTNLIKTSTTLPDGGSNVDFVINDLSIHGQFNTPNEFFSSVEILMGIRQEIRRAGRELLCHRGLKDAQVTSAHTMPQAIQCMPAAKQRAWMQWLTKEGPYWQDSRQHTSDDWLELNEVPIYTDHAIGEVGFCKLHGMVRELVSCDPSDWLQNPVRVSWRRGDDATIDVNVTNHWATNTVSSTLESLPPPFDTWKSLEEHARRICDSIIVSDDAFAPLKGYPYVKSVGEGIAIILGVLNKLDGGFDESGSRTQQFESLYTTFFTGDDPYFTDESVTNKRDYKSKLTFPHPEPNGAELFCSWHGKVNSPRNFPPIRIHFSWPATAKTTVCVVYVGPKITTH